MSLLNHFLEKAIRTSVFSWSHTNTFTAAPGPIIPALSLDILPSDSLTITPTIQIDSLPLVAPQLGRFECSLDYFYMPWRAVIPQMRLDLDNIDPNSIVFPTYIPNFDTWSIPNEIANTEDMRTALTNGGLNNVGLCNVHQSSLESYLYHTFGFNNVVDANAASPSTSSASLALWTADQAAKNGIKYMMYYMAFYYYYANWQQTTYPMFNSAYRYATVSPNNNPSALAWPTVFDARYKDVPYLTWQNLSALRSTVENWANGNHTVANGYSASPNFPWMPNTIQSELTRTFTSFVNYFWFAPRSFARGNATYYFGYTSPFTPMNSRWDGLVCRALDPDMRTSYIRTTTQSRIRSATSIDVSSGRMYIDDFISASRIKQYLELGGFGASGYRNWVYAQFGVTPQDCGCKPSYLGRSRLMMDFNAVVATSSEGLGDLGGRGSGFNAFKRRRFNFKEHGTFMALFSITPIVSYRDGIDLNDTKRTLSECEAPVLNRIGWQPLLKMQLSVMNPGATISTGNTGFPQAYVPKPWSFTGQSPANLTTPGNPYIDVVGYQVAFSEYMATVNRVHGDIAKNLEYWTLIRSFIREPIEDSLSGTAPLPSWEQYGNFENSTYVNPVDYQLAWADASRGAENFIVQVKFDMKLRRPISKSAIPVSA